MPGLSSLTGPDLIPLHPILDVYQLIDHPFSTALMIIALDLPTLPLPQTACFDTGPDFTSASPFVRLSMTLYAAYKSQHLSVKIVRQPRLRP